ncbi:aminopeptidase P family protein [Candidatus Dependentiae bacterium]|nr:MAG: aminopeptidase P family protein [Candidatus Dependentiae bacterium]
MVSVHLFVERRKKLCEQIKKQYKKKNGILCLFGNLEPERGLFRQESSFYYLTGITEPGVILTVDLASDETYLFVPQYAINRSLWMDTATFDVLFQDPLQRGINIIKPLGGQVSGYTMHAFGHINQYANLIGYLQEAVSAQRTIFSLFSDESDLYTNQKLLWFRLYDVITNVEKSLIDIHSLVADMRRKKDQQELDAIIEAISITALAQETAAHVIHDNLSEAEVHGNIKYIMTASGATEGFASIVGSGKNSTVLHYHNNNQIMQNGQLVVVDIGAEKNMYSADITRTYPVAGTFSERQKQVYTVVLETQEYIASIARPGIWLRNKDNPEQSLHHLAKAFLDKKGYGQYFVHGIGHYLGLDIHDVGSYAEPLKEGDVFTIEPGVYITKEQLGIRIEDNYYMTAKGAVCLSDGLAKTVEDVELLMASGKKA